MTNPTEAPMANAIDDVKTGEIPMGAIENGRAHIDRLEHNYDFVGEAGPLGNCSDWHELIRCFEYMANCFTASPAPSQHTGWSDEAVEAAAIAIAKIRMKDGMPPAIAAMVQFDEVFMQRWNGKTDVDLKQVAAYRADAIAALSAASSIAPATGFEVNNLQWKEDRPGSSHMWATSAVGTYTINVYAGMRQAFQLNYNHGPAQYFDTEQAAKDAAQTAFEALIRSSISPSVAKESGEP